MFLEPLEWLEKMKYIIIVEQNEGLGKRKTQGKTVSYF